MFANNYQAKTVPVVADDDLEAGVPTDNGGGSPSAETQEEIAAARFALINPQTHFEDVSAVLDAMRLIERRCFRLVFSLYRLGYTDVGCDQRGVAELAPTSG